MENTNDREILKEARMKHSMAVYGKDGVLTTRGAGERAFRDIARAISLLTSGQVIACDFEGVRAVSVPFIDASVGRLLSERTSGYHEDHPFVILNASEDVRETIGLALRFRRLVALATGKDGASLLGGDDILAETLSAALELQDDWSVHELAQRLKLSPQAANNRVRLLTRSGALQRARVNQPRGGREFRYRVPLAA